MHLHVHSSYSLLEGALKIANLAKLAAADRQPALALTDTNNLFGALEFSEKLAGMGIQPIAGLQLSVAFEEPDPTARPIGCAVPTNVVLLAQTEEGYRNLMRLVSRAYFDVPARRRAAALRRLLLSAHCGGPHRPDGRPDRAARHGAARRRQAGPCAARALEVLKHAFGDQLYVEIQRHGLDDERLDRGRADRARRPQRPAASSRRTSPSSPSPSDYEAHDALLAIAEGRIVADESRRRLSPRA